MYFSNSDRDDPLGVKNVEIHVCPHFSNTIFCLQPVCELFDDNNGVKSFMKELIILVLVIKSIPDPP